MANFAGLANHLCELDEFPSDPFAERNDIVERFSDVRVDLSGPGGQSGREVTLSESTQSREKLKMAETGGGDCRYVAHWQLRYRSMRKAPVVGCYIPTLLKPGLAARA
jgi:hypothetical protein